MKQEWSIRQRPARMDRRYEFDDYEATRSFLERAADLSEREGYYPDMSFGRTYVNVSLQPADEDEGITPELERFAALLDDLIDSQPA